MRGLAAWPLIAALALGSGCSGSSGSSNGGGQAGSDAGTLDSGGNGGVGGSDASAAGSGGMDAGTDAPTDAPLTDGYVPVPTASSIQFAAKNPLPAGEQILFNDWNKQPNRVMSMKPDGSGATEIFDAYRVWSMGVSHSGNQVAFACGDPEQAQHYGITLGDAIQNSFLYDATTQSVSVLDYGNINDECHSFNAADDRVYVCRRYDFTSGSPPTNKGYRLGSIDIASKSFGFITPDKQYQMDLYPQPTADESELYFTRIVITPPNKQTRTIMKMALPNGAPQVVRNTASGNTLSPDGTHYAYADWTDKFKLYVSSLDGKSVVKVADNPGTNLVFSPDGTELAYLRDDATANCSHVEVVHTDGSDASSPTRIRDCSTTGELITGLAWINRK
jgi:hypothetical protein